MRVILDSNIYISYLLNPNAEGPVSFILTTAATGEVVLLISADLLEEFAQKVATKPYLSDRINQKELVRLLDLLDMIGELIPPIAAALPVPRTRDPKDDYLVSAAIVSQTDYLITRDKDLLVLEEIGRTKVIEPTTFAAMLAADT